ncbi:Neurofibromin 1 [Geranomyces variabilis]|nr:Neurofibromin 1 [Geranomyces variabilis]
MATMLLNAFARYEGLHYLSLSLTEPLRDILPFVSGCEIDPQKFPPDMDETAMEDAQAENEARLKSACSRLLTGVVERQSAMPDSLKRMCKYLREIVDEIYREAAAINAAAALNAAAAEGEREGQAAETLVGEEGADAAGAVTSTGTVLPAGESALAVLSEDAGADGSGNITPPAAPADSGSANESKTVAVSEESLNRTQTGGNDTAPPTPYAVTEAPQLPAPVEQAAEANSTDDVSVSRKETLTQEPEQVSRSPPERELGGESALTTTTSSTAATTTGATAVAPSSPSMSGFRLFGRLVGRRPSASSASGEQDDQVVKQAASTDAADAGFPSPPQRSATRSSSRSSYQHSRSFSVENHITRRRADSSTSSWPRHNPNPPGLSQLSSEASSPAASTPSASESSVARVKTLPGGSAAAPAFTTGRKRGTSFASFRSQMPPVAPRTSMGYLTVPEKVVGSFLFLRFFVPAITSPDTYGLIEGRVQPSARRGLVLCGKVLTAMCNDVDFGNKEQYLMCLNHFLRENREKVKDFLVYASASDTEAPDEPAPAPPAEPTEVLVPSSASSATPVPDPPSPASSSPRQSASTTIKSNTLHRPASPRSTLRKAISRSMPSLKPDPETITTTTPTHRRFPLIKSESLPRSRSNSTNKLPAGDGVPSSPSSSATSATVASTTPPATGQHSFYAYLMKSLGKIERDIEEMLFELTPEESEGLLASFFELKRILTGSEGYYAPGATGAGAVGGVGASGSSGIPGSGGAAARQAVVAERLKSKSGTIFAKLSAKWGWKGLFNGTNANSPAALGQRPKTEATTRSLGDLTSLHTAGAGGSSGGRSGSGGTAIGPHKQPPGPSHLSREMLANDASSSAQGFGRA